MSAPPPPPAPQKEGLQAAIDFTKFLLTLAGGAIAFIIQPTTLAGGVFLKGFLYTALGLFGVCVISGLLVFSAGSVNLADGNYNLEDTRIKRWGGINVVSFGLAFLFLTVAVGIKLAQ